jgi:hypothetical protein
MIDKIMRRIRLVTGDSRWWVFFLQRRFMRPATRRRLAARLARRRPQYVRNGLDGTPNPAADELTRSGIAMLGELLSPEACAELRDYFRQRKVLDPHQPGSSHFLPDSTARHPATHVAHHTATDVLRAPHLLALANSPKVLDIVAQFLGCKPTIGYLAAWWSYPTGAGAQEAEHFHRDVDDWRFVKLFVYLTDVGPQSGPHIYVKHSANSQRLTRIKRFMDDEVLRAFGAEAVLPMTAPAGQGFLEDTFGIHKGQPVQSGQRLIFQAVYSMSSLPYGPKAPLARITDFTLPEGLAPDPWTNRIYLT